MGAMKPHTNITMRLKILNRQSLQNGFIFLQFQANYFTRVGLCKTFHTAEQGPLTLQIVLTPPAE